MGANNMRRKIEAPIIKIKRQWSEFGGSTPAILSNIHIEMRTAIEHIVNRAHRLYLGKYHATLTHLHRPRKGPTNRNKSPRTCTPKTRISVRSDSERKKKKHRNPFPTETDRLRFEKGNIIRCFFPQPLPGDQNPKTACCFSRLHVTEST
ncbi:Uncharacterized protein HZ326_10757 [Fusarium oxysporum f. sp. albedinis]|nr:Uncharacterized protein HZ326_10757 [Fusarium oxysporum f. sp. albedinis]